LHYQPVYQVNDHRLVGFEALVRLPGADGTLIPPATFIPVAEEIRAIDAIGAWVLNEACRTAAGWPPHLNIAVNLSPAEFEAGSISATVRNALDASGLEPRRLELEITERLLLKESQHVSEELWKLKKMGVAVVMDDFGTGYSSLSYLLSFPFNKLKIDQSFIQRYGDPSDSAAAVIRAMIALGRELKLRVTVEGVETAEQERFLNRAAGDQAQGFFLGRPLPASEALGVIKAGRYSDEPAVQPQVVPTHPDSA
jgi:EAL domain-containing protein (putative c-di-GMP-specific phosphodiesterase class I)